MTGVIQIIFGLLRVGDVMRFVSKAVMTGFVNALAILIFMAQLPELNLSVPGVSWITYAMVASGLAIIYLLPRVTKSGALARPQPDPRQHNHPHHPHLPGSGDVVTVEAQHVQRHPLSETRFPQCVRRRIRSASFAMPAEKRG